MPVAAQGQRKVRWRVERVREGAVRQARAQIRVLETRFARPLGLATARDGSVADGRSVGDSDGKSSNLRRGRHDDARRCPAPSRASAARVAPLERQDSELICVYARDEGWQNPYGLSYTQMAARC